MLAAAADAVAEVGYSQLTVAQVIGRARVSRKTFYDVFTDREDCFLAVFESVVDRARALVCEACASEPAWREATRTGLARLLALMDEEPALARLCVVDALGAGERVLARRADVIEELVTAVDRGRDGSQRMREPARLASEAVVGGVAAVLHRRLLDGDGEPLANLLGPLMSFIVHPYLGARAAGRELERPPHRAPGPRAEMNGRDGRDPLEGLPMRLTYRTVRVLGAVGEHPGASNREIAERAGISDQGQISKLLTRLSGLGLTENVGEGQVHGAANAWHLTSRGRQLERASRPS